MHPDVTIEFVGDDSVEINGSTMREDFERQYSKKPWMSHVIFTGFVDEAQRDQAIQNCDIFVGPSRYESFGLVYLEAMRAGKPCIGCDVGGIPDVITDGDTGLLVPSADEKALLEAIIRLVEDPQLRFRMGQNGLRDFRTKFTEELMVNSAEAFFEDLVRQARIERLGGPPQPAKYYIGNDAVADSY